MATSDAPKMLTQWAKRAKEIKESRKIIEGHRRTIINDLMRSMYTAVFGIIRQRVRLKKLKVEQMEDCLKVLQALSKLSKEDARLKDLIVSNFPASSPSDLGRASILIEELDDDEDDDYESYKENVQPISHKFTPRALVKAAESRKEKKRNQERERRSSINRMIRQMYSIVFKLVKGRTTRKNEVGEKLCDCLLVIQSLSYCAKKDKKLKALIIHHAFFSSNFFISNILNQEGRPSDQRNVSTTSQTPISPSVSAFCPFKSTGLRPAWIHNGIDEWKAYSGLGQ
nr:hypothetical protein HmN_000094500 [Hymenolepis microstoma]